MSDKKTRRARRLWRHWLKPLLVVLLVVCSFRSAIADWNDVPTGSMKPTILEGDRIFVNKLAYDLKFPFTRWRLLDWGDPVPGEVVVLVSPRDGRRLVKRVIAGPGDRLALRDNRVWINGAPLQYSLVGEAADFLDLEESLGDGHAVRVDRHRGLRSHFRERVIPEGQYFVMGDNRDHSLDSRIFGFVDGDAIVGRAEAVVLSLDPERRYRPRWERFFSALR